MLSAYSYTRFSRSDEQTKSPILKRQTKLREAYQVVQCLHYCQQPQVIKMELLKLLRGVDNHG